MTDIGSNPFAEPDFSAFRSSSTEDATGEAYSDGDVEDLRTRTTSMKAKSSTTSTRFP